MVRLTVIVLVGLPIFSFVSNNVVSAAGWTTTDMGMPFPGAAMHGLVGISVGDGNGDNSSEVYAINGDDACVYQYDLIDGEWGSNKIGTLLNGRLNRTSGIMIGDGENDGRSEVYATTYDDTVAYYHVFQISLGTNGWNTTNCGAAGDYCYDLALGDGDGDARNEIYTAHWNGHIYRYSKSANWSVQDIGKSPSAPSGLADPLHMKCLAIGDGDNDGLVEVYGGCSDSHIYKFNYTGTEWKRSDVGSGVTSGKPWGIPTMALGDGDNDGNNELYAADSLNSTIWQYKWNETEGEWNITCIVTMGPSLSVNDMCVADADSDGANGIYLGASNNHIYEVVFNGSDLTWGLSSIGSGNDAINAIAIGRIGDNASMSEVFAACADGHGYEFYKDNVPPANPIVWSDTHPDIKTWYGNNTVHVMWNDTGFDRSGLDGYSYIWDGVADTIPDDIKDYEENVHELSTDLGDGFWYFHIKARDNCLNWNRSATTFGPIVIDANPPRDITITINNGREYTNVKTVALSITATDGQYGLGIDKIAFSNDGSGWSDWEPFSANRSGWDLTDPRFGGNSTDGLKSVYVRIKDVYGNELPPEKRSSDSIFLDRMAPENITIVALGGNKFTSSADVTIALEARDPEPASGLSKMAFSNDGLVWSEWLNWNDSAIWSLTAGEGGMDTDGTKMVLFRVIDRAGNMGGPASDIIILDRGLPENLSVKINGGAGFTNCTFVDLLINVNEPIPGSGLSEMSIANDAGSPGPWESFTPVKARWDLVSGAGGTDVDGYKSVFLKVRDRAGNVAGQVNSTIFLDRSKPGPLDIKINGGANLTSNRTVLLTLDSPDPQPSSDVLMQFSTDGIAWSDWEPFSAIRSFSLTTPDGLKTIFFRTEDRAGNIADAVSASITLDTRAPIISDVRVPGITDISALVTWTTNEPADSGVDFGIDSSYGKSKLEPEPVTSHSLVLTGLTAATSYHFRIYSRDLAGNGPAYTSDYIFTTAAIPDKMPPAISDVLVSGITDRLAIISWTTDEPGDSLIEYGRESTTDQMVLYSSRFELKHNIILAGLSPSTSYHFQVGSTDMAGNGPSKSSTRMFATKDFPDVLAPFIMNIHVSGITDTLAIIIWETDEPSNGFVEYGDTPSYGEGVTSIAMETVHEVTLRGLSPSSGYHFRIKSWDATGNGPSISQDIIFMTGSQPDTTPPSISNLRVEGITDRTATILWDTNEMADSFVEYGQTTDYEFISSIHGYSLQHNLLLRDLLQDKVYHLRVCSTDPSGNGASSNDIVFQTKNRSGEDLAPPVISGLKVAGISNTRAVVLWDTDEAANGEVEYGTTGAFGIRTGNPSYTQTHSFLLSGLEPSTEYHLRVYSVDAYGNGPSVSDDIWFVTFNAPDLTPPNISNIRCVNITNTSAIITWTTDEPATSLVEFGTGGLYNSNQSARILSLNHSIELTGLNPATTYNFHVVSVDPAGNVARASQTFTFTTAGPEKPPNGGPDNNQVPGGGVPWLWSVAGALLVALGFGIVLFRRSIAGRFQHRNTDGQGPRPKKATRNEGDRHGGNRL